MGFFSSIFAKSSKPIVASNLRLIRNRHCLNGRITRASARAEGTTFITFLNESRRIRDPEFLLQEKGYLTRLVLKGTLPDPDEQKFDFFEGSNRAPDVDVNLQFAVGELPNFAESDILKDACYSLDKLHYHKESFSDEPNPRELLPLEQKVSFSDEPNPDELVEINFPTP